MSPPPLPLIVLMAAGASRRMGPGRDKLLEKVRGQPLLRDRAIMARATGAGVLVTLPPDRPARLAALQGLDVVTAMIGDAAEGMAASLRFAAATAGAQARGLMVLPADMPDLTTEDLGLLLQAAQAAPEGIHRATATAGAPGHPVVFPLTLLPLLQQLQGDEGARSVLQSHAARICLHPLPGDHALTDLDTPEAWTAWRAAQ